MQPQSDPTSNFFSIINALQNCSIWGKDTGILQLHISQLRPLEVLQNLSGTCRQENSDSWRAILCRRGCSCDMQSAKTPSSWRMGTVPIKEIQVQQHLLQSLLSLLYKAYHICQLTANSIPNFIIIIKEQNLFFSSSFFYQILACN